MYQGHNESRETNPREHAGIFSIITFWFTYSIFKKGIRKELEEDDVYEILKDYKSSKLGDQLEKEWEKEKVKPEVSLIYTLLRVFGKEYIICGLVQMVVRTSFMVIKPLALGRLVSYFSGKSNLTKDDAYMYAGIIIATTVLSTIYNHGYMLYIQQLAQKIRISLCSLMYRKSLKLSSSSLIEIKNGQIVTLMAKDVNLFDSAIIFAHDLWIGVIQVVVMTYIMYKEIQESAIYGVGFLVLLAPVQLWIGNQTTKTRLKTAAKSDERIRLIQEVLSTIHIIKMYTWEKYFSKLVNYLRKGEIGKLKIIFYLKATIMSIGNLSTRISFYICIMTYISYQNHITAEKAFTVLSCYGSLRSVLTVAIPLGISQIADLMSSIKRIKKYLLTPEVTESAEAAEITKKSDEPKVAIKNVSAGILKKKDILHDITIELNSGLYALTGTVGSGKTTFVKLLLHDVIITEGHVDVNGTVSYASQEPWLFPGTIRQNILFGLPFKANRYQTVVRICGLRKDLDNFASGDRTLVHDRGLNLSKGQQSRINLARAVYKEADIYILDNPLCALDIKVGKLVFKNCIKEFLSNKLCILITNRKQYLKDVDNILVMNDGTIEHQGSFQDLERSAVNFGVETDKNEEPDVDEEEGEDFLEETDETQVLVKSTTSINTKASKLYSETKKVGRVDPSVYKTYFKYAGGLKTIPILLLLYVVGQGSASYFDYFVTYWIKVEEKLVVLDANLTSINLDGYTNESSLANNETYAEYNNMLQAQSDIPMMYTIIILVTTVAMLVKSFLFFNLTSRSSLKLHYASFSKLVKAQMHFFDANLTGNILNRFSKDFSVSDEFIPYIIFECLRIVFILIGVLVLITTVNIIFLFISFGFGVVLFVIRYFYLPTSRSLRRLDGTTRSPVIGHLNASLEGISTIRAAGAQQILKAQFDRHQDLHSSTSYMYLTTNRAFGFLLDMLCSLYVTIIILSFLMFASNTDAGKVGLAITQAFGLTGLLQWGIRQWAELENQMTSVERVLEYTEVPTENRQGSEPDCWPDEGKIVYKGVRLRYPKTNEVVLKNISFKIEPQEKIGIIGRTGAGKSSIISALFRLYDIESGTILIDNYDIKTVALHKLRSSISIIPQNPILFSGTLRSNLDPDGLYHDKDLWRALEAVEMKPIVAKLDYQLDCLINEGGFNFSGGQKQLICLARALLHHNKIIVLDEATANIDPQTDILIQKTIKKQFSQCTILTIAHRLDSVLKSDRVMVVDGGDIVEFDNPDTLLNMKDSLFHELVSQSGLLQT